MERIGNLCSRGEEYGGRESDERSNEREDVEPVAVMPLAESAFGVGGIGEEIVVLVGEPGLIQRLAGFSGEFGVGVEGQDGLRCHCCTSGDSTLL